MALVSQEFAVGAAALLLDTLLGDRGVGGGGGSMLLFRLHGGNVFARLGRGAAELHTCSFLTAKYKAMGTAKPQKAISSVRRAVNLKRRW